MDNFKMDHVRNKIKTSKFIRLIWNPWFPFFCLFVFYGIIHLPMGLTKDDFYFQEVFHRTNVVAYFWENWELWSSRVLVSTVSAFFCFVPIIFWKIVNLFICMSIPYMCYRFLLKKEQNIPLAYVVCVLTVCYPYQDQMTSAGNVVTTTFYYWTLAAGLFSVYYLNRVRMGLKVTKIQYVFSLLATIFACNFEQTNLFFIFVYVFVAVIFTFYKKNKSVLRALWTQVIIASISLLVIFICPGNANRNEMAIAGIFPDFYMLGFFKKLEIAYTATMYRVFLKGEILFVILTLLIFILACSKTKSKKTRALYLVPFLITGTFSYDREIWFRLLSKIIPSQIAQLSVNEFSLFSSDAPMKGSISFVSYDNPVTYFFLILFGIVAVLLLAELYSVISDPIARCFIPFLVFAGFATRMSLSLSSTIWFSGSRTYLYFDFSILIAVLYLCYEGKVRSYEKTVVA